MEQSTISQSWIDAEAAVSEPPDPTDQMADDLVSASDLLAPAVPGRPTGQDNVPKRSARAVHVDGFSPAAPAVTTPARPIIASAPLSGAAPLRTGDRYQPLP